NHHRSSLADHMAEPGPREMDVLVPGGRIDLNPLLRVTAGTASVDDAQVPRVAACATKARAINRLVTSHWRWCKEQGRRCCARDIDRKSRQYRSGLGIAKQDHSRLLHFDFAEVVFLRGNAWRNPNPQDRIEIGGFD